MPRQERVRGRQAKAAASFCHSRLSSVEHSGEIVRPTVIRAPAVSEGGLMATDPPSPDNASPAMLRAEARERERLEARYVVYSFLIGLTLGAWVTLLVCRLM
jgi:hypothetical protein